jgi:hypothetical protein
MIPRSRCTGAVCCSWPEIHVMSGAMMARQELGRLGVYRDVQRFSSVKVESGHSSRKTWCQIEHVSGPYSSPPSPSKAVPRPAQGLGDWSNSSARHPSSATFQPLRRIAQRGNGLPTCKEIGIGKRLPLANFNHVSVLSVKKKHKSSPSFAENTPWRSPSQLILFCLVRYQPAQGGSFAGTWRR